MMAHHRTLTPGQKFPDVVVPKVGGGQLSLRPNSTKPRIIVVYRGLFCPFCKATVIGVRDKKQKLDDAGVEVVFLSSDTEDAAKGLVTELGLPADMTVAYGLTPAQMVELGLYMSEPYLQMTQKQRFAEPATFMLNPDGTIKYLEYSSMPMGGRINVDNYLAGYAFSTQNAKEHPEFGKVVWGSLPQ